MKSLSTIKTVSLLAKFGMLMLIVASLIVFNGYVQETAFASDNSSLRVGTFGKGVSTAAVNSKVPISRCSISVQSPMSYTSVAVRPALKIRYQNRILVEGRDYTLSYRKNIGIGTASVVVTGKGAYTGATLKAFEIKWSNAAIATAACKLSYSKSRVKGRAVSRNNGYRGTVLYRKYASRKNLMACSRIGYMAINRYLGVDKKYPLGAAKQRKYMRVSKYWKKICRYKPGMEFKKNTKLKPGDVYNSGDHACLYVGSTVPKSVYYRYLKVDKATKKKQKKACADLGCPSRKAVWVSSHATYMKGSAAHICGPKDALVRTHRGYIYRYVGPGCADSNNVTQ